MSETGATRRRSPLVASFPGSASASASSMIGSYASARSTSTTPSCRAIIGSPKTKKKRLRFRAAQPVRGLLPTYRHDARRRHRRLRFREGLPRRQSRRLVGRFFTSEKGTDFVQPFQTCEHWHIDIRYLNIAGRAASRDGGLSARRCVGSEQVKRQKLSDRCRSDWRKSRRSAAHSLDMEQTFYPDHAG